MTTETNIEEDLISKLQDLKYTYRSDIRNRAALERNFREKFEALNRVHLTDAEFERLLEQIITPDVFAAAHILRERNAFERDDGTPLNFTLVNIRDWCKNSFEVDRNAILLAGLSIHEGGPVHVNSLGNRINISISHRSISCHLGRFRQTHRIGCRSKAVLGYVQRIRLHHRMSFESCLSKLGLVKRPFGRILFFYLNLRCRRKIFP
jgi:hypothetical protein